MINRKERCHIQAAIIVYDTHAPSTFEKTKMWMEVVRNGKRRPHHTTTVFQLRDKSDIGPEMIAVVGNKDDLKNGLITEEEGRVKREYRLIDQTEFRLGIR